MSDHQLPSLVSPYCLEFIIHSLLPFNILWCRPYWFWWTDFRGRNGQSISRILYDYLMKSTSITFTDEYWSWISDQIGWCRIRWLLEWVESNDRSDWIGRGWSNGIVDFRLDSIISENLFLERKKERIKKFGREGKCSSIWKMIMNCLFLLVHSCLYSHWVRVKISQWELVCLLKGQNHSKWPCRSTLWATWLIPSIP